MGPWSKIDELRNKVATSPLIEVDAARDGVRPKITTLEAAKAALDKTNFAPERLVVFGWEVLLSRRKQSGSVIWHLSVKLHPHGRASTKSDWKVIGQIAARVRAPRDPVIMPEDPHAPIHWSWPEQ